MHQTTFEDAYIEFQTVSCYFKDGSAVNYELEFHWFSWIQPGGAVMDKRMTWKEIQDTYPDQWVGLTDCEMINEVSVKSAIVKYTEADHSADEISLMALKGEIVGRYTTPDHVFLAGALMV